MQSELEKVSAEIEEATRCMGDGSDDQAAVHLAAAAAMLETLVQDSARKPADSTKPVARFIAA
jgi:hypothetical protein